MKHTMVLFLSDGICLLDTSPAETPGIPDREHSAVQQQNVQAPTRLCCSSVTGAFALFAYLRLKHYKYGIVDCPYAY